MTNFDNKVKDECIFNDNALAATSKKFKYEGHDYILFITPNGRFSNSTVIHSSDYPCLDDYKDLVNKMQ